MRNITLAKSAGFCFGVNRAVDIAYKLSESSNGGCTLGPIIHNKELVEELKNKGIISVNNIDDVKNYKSVIIRSHGVAKSVIDEISKMDVELIDATCPFVAKIHKIVAQASKNDKTVLVAGDRNHPEVQGIIGHLTENSEYYTFNDDKELKEIIDNIPKENNKLFCVVAQTTFNVELFKKCVKILKKVYTNAEIFDTICNATSVRQTQAALLAEKSDCMIIIGDNNSSNTHKLYSICKSHCNSSYLIETAADLDLSWLDGCENIGVTAGASTPDRIIKEVLDKMTEEMKSGVTNESFEEMLEESLKTLNTNERVTGVVVGIAPNEVFVDVGRKQAGFIPLEELSAAPISSPEDVVKIGDEIELLIMKTNDQEGTIMLSKKRVDAKKGFEKLEKAYEDKETLTGVVTEVINGGVIVICNDTRVFVPASQATLNRDDDLQELKGQEVKFRLIEVSQRGRRQKIIGSIRSVLREEFAEIKNAFWESCEVGKTYTGTVKTLTSYGAFVDLGGASGMIHISELSWLRIKHPSEVVNVGDTVEVYIKDINDETKKISLGYKKTEDNPWLILEQQYPVGTVVKAKVVGLTTFGAFANIIPGIDGLIHISQISNKRIEKPADELKVGDEVEAKIIAIDFDKKRVSLSIRALLPEPVVEAKEENDSTEDEIVAVAESDGEVTVADTVAVEEATEE